MQNDRRKHFKQREKKIDAMMWDIEFDRFQKNHLREEIRQQHDRVFETVQNIKKQLETPPEGTTPEQITERETDLKAKEESLETLVAQIKLLDDEISGSNPELPPSIQARMDGLHQIKELLTKFLNVN